MKRGYSKYEKYSLLDIKFSNGVVEVPCFPIDEVFSYRRKSESLFKNLVAFEQADPRFGNGITAYVVFMSQFVSTPEDVVLLTKKGFIEHMLDSDDEVPALFTRLTKQVSFGSDEYYHLRSLCWGIGGSLSESAKQMVGMAVEKSLQQSMVGISCPSCSYHAPVYGYSNHFYCPCLHQAPRIVVRFLSGDLHLFLFCPTIFKIQILGFQLVAKIHCNTRPIFHQILPYSSADTLSHFSQTWQNTILLLSLWIVWKRRNRKTFDSEDLDTGSTLRLFGDHLKAEAMVIPSSKRAAF